MPSWTELGEEIKESCQEIVSEHQFSIDSQEIYLQVFTEACGIVRKKYLNNLSKKRERNIIAYYSGFLQRRPESNEGLSINDEDKNGLMSAVYRMDRNKGLDIILHTPGGDITATESFIKYLYKMFNEDIVAIVPQIAMSGGTLIACASKEILMGKQSNIGPIDPQFGGLPILAILDEFDYLLEMAEKKPSAVPLFQTMVEKYHPGFLVQCKHAVDLSTSIAKDVLKKNMLKTKDNEYIENVVDTLNNHAEIKTHARHIHADEARDIGLIIKDIEEDQELQDAILSVHHMYMHTFQRTRAIKIIENQDREGISISSN